MRLLLSLLIAAPLVLGAAGCDSLRPSDEPLPSFEELREAFDGQPPGRGLVQEDNGSPYEASAVHYTDVELGPQDTVYTFVVRLQSDLADVVLVLYETARSDLVAGTRLERLSVSYSAPDCIGSGSGRIEVTATDGDRVGGVFAADVSTTTLTPCFRRLTGGFNAVSAQGTGALREPAMASPMVLPARR
jgi:hypothetical protein